MLAHRLEIGAENGKAMERGFQQRQREAFLAAWDKQRIGDPIELREAWIGNLHQLVQKNRMRLQPGARLVKRRAQLRERSVVRIRCGSHEQGSIDCRVAKSAQNLQAECDPFARNEACRLQQHNIALEQPMDGRDFGELLVEASVCAMSTPFGTTCAPTPVISANCRARYSETATYSNRG